MPLIPPEKGIEILGRSMSIINYRRYCEEQWTINMMHFACPNPLPFWLDDLYRFQENRPAFAETIRAEVQKKGRKVITLAAPEEYLDFADIYPLAEIVNQWRYYFAMDWFCYFRGSLDYILAYIAGQDLTENIYITGCDFLYEGDRSEDENKRRQDEKASASFWLGVIAGIGKTRIHINPACTLLDRGTHFYEKGYQPFYGFKYVDPPEALVKDVARDV